MKFIRHIAALLVILLLLTPVALAQDTEEEVAEFANPEILVDTDWILENTGEEGIVLLFIGGELEDYEAEHIPGALFVSLADLNNPEDDVTGQIGTSEQVAETLGSLGIEADDTVVLYDASNNLLAARAFWVLKYYQHENVVIYEGGSKLWEADGQEFVSGDAPEVEAVDYEIAEADPEIRTTGDYVLEHLDDAGVQLCDTRSINEYIGTDVRADRGGHIPGAISLEWVNTVDPQTGKFKTYDELDELFKLAGFDREKQIITYCQTGVRGAHVWFVLRELLGYEDVRNYDGSWIEYGNNLEAPIEN
ncbi:MAG: sulfurtransferase [Anaerolineae bacterium]|nr:sulfurtransferase [Anaerolineae bacterium]